MWVHGYGSSAGDGSKNNVRYGNDGSILYYSSNTAIALSKVVEEEGATPSWAQKYFTFHTKSICALNVNQSGTLCATADCNDDGLPASIHVWKTLDCSLKVSIMVSKFSSVQYLDFSSDDK